MGSKLYFEIRMPSNWELTNVPTIELTSLHWNPCDLVKLTQRIVNVATAKSTMSTVLSIFLLLLTSNSLDHFIPPMAFGPLQLQGEHRSVMIIY
jgi:hypothetical protein